MKKNHTFPFLYLNAFIHPRRTVQYVFEKKNGGYFWPLLLTFGFFSLFTPEIYLVLAHFLPVACAMPLGALISFAAAIAYVLLFSWLIYLFGKVLGGTGTSDEVRIAYMWSGCPAILAVFFKALGSSFLWKNLFLGVPDLKIIFSHPDTGWQNIAMGFYSILFIWGWIVEVPLIAEAHHFSKWKAFLCVVFEIVSFVFLLVLVGIFIAIGVIMSQHH